ncbi:MAG: SDR family NAD(P)-dependent oxidoreductase, partial [Terricaulis sp.]
MKRAENKVALVTGASLGLGRACAMMLAREGAKVMVTDLKEPEGRAVADKIVEAGGEAMFMRQDVSSEADWDATIAATVRRFGRLDILVN